MNQLQHALYHRPGRFGCVALYNARTSKPDLKSVAELLASAESDQLPDNLHILIAINPSLIRDKLSQNGHATHDLLVQVAAGTRRDMYLALRLARALLENEFRFEQEIYGGDFMFGAEPFGFYDGASYNDDEVNKIARIKDGPAEDGSWLLYERYEYHLTDFMAASAKDRWEAVGAEFARHDIDTPSGELPDDAHTKLMKASDDKMVRRGIPYRLSGKEGLAFIAASADLEALDAASKKMKDSAPLLAKNIDKVDADYLFVLPPDTSWLVGKEVEPPTLPPSVEALLLRTELGEPLVMDEYIVGAHFLEFISGIRDVAFEGEGVNPEVQVLIDGIIAIAAGGSLKTNPEVDGADPGKQERLSGLYDLAVSEAVRYNFIAGRYMTLN